MTVVGRNDPGGLWTQRGKRVAGRLPPEPLKNRLPRVPVPRLRYVIAVTVTTFLLGGGAILYQQPLFRIATVTVTGTETLKPDQVRAAVKLEGQHLFEVSDTSVAESLSGLTRVRQVSVVRQLPNTIEIQVTERRPWAVWQSGDAKYTIDEDGVVLDLPAAAGLPAIVVKSSAPTRPGARVDADLVRQAISIDRRLAEAITAKAVRYEYTEPGGLLLITSEGYQVRFGTADDLDFKLATLKAMVDSARANKTAFTAIDLRFGARPFLR